VFTKYEGSELELFERATNWKAYFGSLLQPYLRGSVLEVGAGLGGTTKRLCGSDVVRWTALEPDGELADQLRAVSTELPPDVQFEAVHGTLENLDPSQGLYDTALYLDVLEHIEQDAEELRRCCKFLKPGGHLVVLSPAHQWLYTDFDRGIGHFRRYTRDNLTALTPQGSELIQTAYLDSVGIMASAANRVLLRSSMPTAKQIAVWDRLMVPVSRVIDPWLGHRIGKSILAVWRRMGAKKADEPSTHPQHGAVA
jgi:SAM-dependent methyltransferase